MKALCCNAGCSYYEDCILKGDFITIVQHRYFLLTEIVAVKIKMATKDQKNIENKISSRTISISSLGKVTFFRLICGGCDKHRRILPFFNKMFLSYELLYFTFVASNFRDHVNALPNNAKFRILGLK